jgi:hypothetical protein
VRIGDARDRLADDAEWACVAVRVMAAPHLDHEARNPKVLMKKLTWRDSMPDGQLTDVFHYQVGDDCPSVVGHDVGDHDDAVVMRMGGYNHADDDRWMMI